MTFSPANTISPSIYSGFTLPNDQDEWRDILMDRELQTESVVNGKQNGTFTTVEYPTGQQWFSTANPRDTRGAFRKVIDFGALPNAALKQVAHGLTVDADFLVTRLEAFASDTTGFTYVPIPYAAAAGLIELSMDNTNINITTTTNRTNYNSCYVIVEFLRN